MDVSGPLTESVVTVVLSVAIITSYFTKGIADKRRLLITFAVAIVVSLLLLLGNIGLGLYMLSLIIWDTMTAKPSKKEPAEETPSG